jgi:hypothetical protein
VNLVFLSNQLIRDHDETDCGIAALLEPWNNPTIFDIPSQADRDRCIYSRAVAYYARFGIRVADYFDLEDGNDAGRAEEMLQPGAVHLRGGSTYHFMQSLRRRGFLSSFKNMPPVAGFLSVLTAVHC